MKAKYPWLAALLASALILVPLPASAAPVIGVPEQIVTTARSGTYHVAIILTQSRDDNNPDPADDPIASNAGVTIVLSRLVDANQEHIAAATMAELATWETDLRITAETDCTGTAQLRDLPEGIYLVTSQSPNDGMAYQEVQPFLLAIPFYLDQDRMSETGTGVIVAKHRVPETPTPTGTSLPPPTTVPGSSHRSGPLAMTGANIAWLVVAAVSFIALGVLLLTHSRRCNDPQD